MYITKNYWVVLDTVWCPTPFYTSHMWDTEMQYYTWILWKYAEEKTVRALQDSALRPLNNYPYIILLPLSFDQLTTLNDERRLILFTINKKTVHTIQHNKTRLIWYLPYNKTKPNPFNYYQITLLILPHLNYWSPQPKQNPPKFPLPSSDHQNPRRDPSNQISLSTSPLRVKLSLSTPVNTSLSLDPTELFFTPHPVWQWGQIITFTFQLGFSPSRKESPRNS